MYMNKFLFVRSLIVSYISNKWFISHSVLGNLYAGTADGHIKGWESAVITDFIISEKASQNLKKEFENLQFYDKRKGYVSDGK